MAHRALLAAAFALALALPAQASGMFAGDGKVFSGIAADDGEGLFVPQTLTAGRVRGFDNFFETDSAGTFGLFTGVGGGTLGSGLAAFPDSYAEEYDVQARLTGAPILGGFTPYVGVGVSSTANDSIFQGIPHLLPYEGSTFAIQGVAGIAYELMPGLGAGIEYTYRGYVQSTPVPGDASDNQTIMMRLDLGLN